MDIPKKNEIVSIDVIEEICAEHGLLKLWAKIKADPPEKPFKSDGCSMWPDSFKSEFTGEKVSIYDCCFLHDLAYWSGWPEKDNPREQIDRFIADAALVCGVVKATGRAELGETMWLGIRAGGVGWLRLPFSWGFGRI